MKKTFLIFSLLLIITPVAWGQVDRVTVKITDTISLNMEREKFDTTGKVYEYYDNKFPFSINGVPIFGTDGDVPHYTLTKAVLTIGEIEYDLQIDNMYNPWFGVLPSERRFIIRKDGTEIRLAGFFSDGAGSYAAEWLIAGNSSIRTILTKDNWILYEYFERGE